MGTYRQYCPIARTSEILAERWTPLVIRNLMLGAKTFTELARGLPTMSRSMLAKRLKDLERSGVIRSARKPDGNGSTYHLTEAGADLAAVITAMGEWGDRWLEVTSEHSDPGFALWAWCQAQLDRSKLPDRRTVVAFVFPEEPPTNRRYWLLADDGDAEICYSEPGGHIDLHVTARSIPFVEWHRGVVSWTAALRAGDITVTGARALARSIASWNLHAPIAPRT